MTLNPIVALSEQLQKLINEHGSAAILRDHLALFKDQVINLEKQLSVLTLENGGLNNKVKTLESKLENATKEINRLNQIIKTLQGAKSVEELDPITQKTVELLFDSGQECSVTHIATILSMDVNTVRYHFDILKEKGFIEQSRAEPEMYEATPSGRRYIVKTRTS